MSPDISRDLVVDDIYERQLWSALWIIKLWLAGLRTHILVKSEINLWYNYATIVNVEFFIINLFLAIVYKWK